MKHRISTGVMVVQNNHILMVNHKVSGKIRFLGTAGRGCDGY